MPIVYEIRRKHTHVVVWEVSETNEKLLQMLDLDTEKQSKFDTLTDKRKREYLGIRACFHYLSIEGDILYEESGKPYIKSNHHISISHSWGKVAFTISKFAVGIDIEKNRPQKIRNIQHKFIRKDEESFIEEQKLDDYLHVIWGIKESQYKLHDGNLWSFLNHYRVQSFQYNRDDKVICEIIDKEHHTQYYTAYYERIKDGFYLIYVLDNIL
ncbi:MAG: 4'-phosphopantetheinyl transferase family protein [Flavobacteriales bacterium]